MLAGIICFLFDELLLLLLLAGVLGLSGIPNVIVMVVLVGITDGGGGCGLCNGRPIRGSRCGGVGVMVVVVLTRHRIGCECILYSFVCLGYS